MLSLRRILARNVTQKRFNLENIRSGKEVPRLKLFSGGNWIESSGSHEIIPNPLDKRKSIAEVPILDLQQERNMFKQSMQKVAILTQVPQIGTLQLLQKPTQIQRNRGSLPQTGASLARTRHCAILRGPPPPHPGQIRATSFYGVSSYTRFR